MIVKSILIFSALIYNVVSQHDLDHNEMTTPGSVENCVTVHNCCERYDGECVLYCEPVIECPTTTENRRGFNIIISPCRKGLKRVAGRCIRVF